MLFFNLMVLMFSLIYLMFLHYRIRIQNKSYLLFWAYRYIWQYMDNFAYLIRYWFSSLYIIIILVFVWIFMHWWLLLRLIVLFLYGQLYILYHRLLNRLVIEWNSFILFFPFYFYRYYELLLVCFFIEK